MGDFSESSDNTMLKEVMESHQFTLAINETGNRKRTEMCFTNINSYTCGSHEIDFLNNKLLWIKLKMCQLDTFHS